MVIYNFTKIFKSVGIFIAMRNCRPSETGAYQYEIVYVPPIMIVLKLALIWWFFSWDQPIAETFDLGPTVTGLGEILVIGSIIFLIFAKLHRSYHKH